MFSVFFSKVKLSKLNHCAQVAQLDSDVKNDDFCLKPKRSKGQKMSKLCPRSFYMSHLYLTTWVEVSFQICQKTTNYLHLCHRIKKCVHGIVLPKLFWPTETKNCSSDWEKLAKFLTSLSAAASGWAEWALAHPEFGSSVNPITTRGADYAHHITASPPGFEIPAAPLL